MANPIMRSKQLASIPFGLYRKKYPLVIEIELKITHPEKLNDTETGKRKHDS
jgi:hypothetical protein